ncbi:hypothetical protein GGI23_004430 [Coemansia sp. RSA 2559]|nr:hypothetical protein GGI23_004430 [Coemansia sp. RSA 2559]
MLAALQRLCADSRNFVCVISGRDRQFLDLHLGAIKGLALSGEHGSFIRYPSGEWISLLDQVDMGWKDEVLSIFEFFTERTAGSTIEAKETSITWHFRNADPEYGEFQAKECMSHLEDSVVSKLPVEILVGKKCLEVRPISVNKGEIVKRLMGTHPEQWDFVACAGDDKTDEDMFRALRTMQRSIGQKRANGNDELPQEPQHYFTITVGPVDKKSAAAWHVTSSNKVVEMLIELAATE